MNDKLVITNTLAEIPLKFEDNAQIKYLAKVICAIVSLCTKILRGMIQIMPLLDLDHQRDWVSYIPCIHK